MLDLYGPNSLKVGNYIKALQSMSRREFSTVDCLTNLDKVCPKHLLERLRALKGVRLVERNNAFEDTIAAINDKGSGDQRDFVSAIASILVIADLLTESDRLFIEFHIIHPKIPLIRIYEGRHKEDEAIDEFCRRLTRMDGQTVYVKRRPDQRGQSGQGLPDFVVHRNGEDFTVEHTLINVYEKQVFYENLFGKFLEPRKIEHEIKEVFPRLWITISIPINLFESEREARQFNFLEFKQNLVWAIGRTEIGRYGSKRKTFQFARTKFPVHVAVDEGFWDCRVMGIVPARAQIEENLQADITRAIERKRQKLQQSKARGELTVLLLDCDDYGLVCWEMLADAFGRATASESVSLEGVDQVYIQHRGAGCCWILPVKMGTRIYPNLTDLEEYWDKQAEILIVGFPRTF